MTLAELFDLAEQFRKAIEQVSPELRPIGLQNFPRGACGDSSLLLGAYLNDCGISDFKYICGERGTEDSGDWSSHAWLQRGECIVDITADQFADAPAAVIVLEPSAWHSSFGYREVHQSDFRLYTGFGLHELSVIYSRITRTLKQN